MADLTRRTALAAAAGAGAGFLADAAFAAGAAAPRAGTLVLQPAQTLNAVPQAYTGVSVEKMQLSDPAYFNAANTGLVALHKRLSPHGVLRIGGNSSEFCWWDPDGRAAPKVRAYGIGRADNWMPQTFTAIRPAAVAALKGFLDACGWTCIWGFNFGTGTPARNAEEAAFVAKTLGERIKYFQIGNEPDFYREANNRLRPEGWDFPDYIREWTANAKAISAAVPGARFGGPDVGGNSAWVARFAREGRARIGKRLVELTGHYYASGPPDAAYVSAKFLLAPNTAAAKRMGEIGPAARAAGLGYRMSEGNSCYRGGKAGMSDAFAAALWGGDYMLAMAAHGCKGINFHCGSGAAIAHSLGGKLPGARNAADMKRAELGAFYAPIAGSRKAGFDARPLFYGMMLAEQFAGATMFGCRASFAGVNATAYAAKVSGGYRVALFNKDAGRDLKITVSGAAGASRGALWRLAGPSLTAIEGTTLAGCGIAHQSAAWHPRRVERLTSADGAFAVAVPRASAALLFLGDKA